MVWLRLSRRRDAGAGHHGGVPRWCSGLQCQQPLPSGDGETSEEGAVPTRHHAVWTITITGAPLHLSVPAALFPWEGSTLCGSRWPVLSEDLQT